MQTINYPDLFNESEFFVKENHPKTSISQLSCSIIFRYNKLMK